MEKKVEATIYYLGFRVKGQGDLVSRLIVGISRVYMGYGGLLSYLLSPPDPPSGVQRGSGFKV